MTIDGAIALMENEKACIVKADTCDRDCAKCELVKKTEDLLSAYDMAICALKMQKKLAKYSGMDICQWIEDYDYDENNISEYEYETSVDNFLIDNDISNVKRRYIMLEFYHVKHPKARKEHICDLCGSKILLGQTYERYSGKYDGDMFDLKYCLDCEKVIDAFLDENECNEYSDDDIYDWLREKFCYDCKYGDYDVLDDCTVNKFRCPTILAKIKK